MNIEELKRKYPGIEKLISQKEFLWKNPNKGLSGKALFTMEDVYDAEARLQRFAPYIAKVFPETEKSKGIIESELREITYMKSRMTEELGGDFPGRLYLKMDSNLPISGSVKARGGIYEVLKFAEKIALESGLLKEDDNYEKLVGEEFRKLFFGYSVAVGSTGNLGLSIGTISAKMGFKVYVHMSRDAREWKKNLLRERGATVIEYDDDYSKAVSEGRKEAEKDPNCHFVDDEGSHDLFLGYATAGLRLANYLDKQGILCDSDHPLFLYIPCGVGSAPGGITFGIKSILGDNVHVFFSEPTHAPCMTLGLMTGLHDKIAVSDIGLDGKTAADGLAVGRASRLVGEIVGPMIDGCFTIDDEKLYPYLADLADTEGILVEPSACAGFSGPKHVLGDKDYLAGEGLLDKLEKATHIVWATGGGMVPEEEMKVYYNRGKA